MCCRRAQLRYCLEELKKQVPLSTDSMRNTTLNLLRRAQLHIKVKIMTKVKGAQQSNTPWHRVPGFYSPVSIYILKMQKLQEQDERAEQLKGHLRWEQKELRIRLEQLQMGTERMRNDSQGSTMSSERSDSDRGMSLTQIVSLEHLTQCRKICSSYEFITNN